MAKSQVTSSAVESFLLTVGGASKKSEVIEYFVGLGIPCTHYNVNGACWDKKNGNIVIVGDWICTKSHEKRVSDMLAEKARELEELRALSTQALKESETGTKTKTKVKEPKSEKTKGTKAPVYTKFLVHTWRVCDSRGGTVFFTGENEDDGTSRVLKEVFEHEDGEEIVESRDPNTYYAGKISLFVENSLLPLKDGEDLGGRAFFSVRCSQENLWGEVEVLGEDFCIYASKNEQPQTGRVDVRLDDDGYTAWILT